MSELRFRAYNHISNGGISFELTETSKHLLLGITSSQFGVMSRFTTPMLEDSARMLRALADVIDKHSQFGGRTQAHLLNGRSYHIYAPSIGIEESIFIPDRHENSLYKEGSLVAEETGERNGVK